MADLDYSSAGSARVVQMGRVKFAMWLLAHSCEELPNKKFQDGSSHGISGDELMLGGWRHFTKIKGKHTMINLAYITELLEKLTLPGTVEQSEGSDVRKAVDDSLAANISRVEECLNLHPCGEELRNKLHEVQLAKSGSHGEESTRWKYVKTCLKLLLCLQDGLGSTERLDNNEGKDVEVQELLSMHQEKIVVSCIQFVIGLGIIPNLLPGVGLPLEKRSGFSSIVKYPAAQNISSVQKQVQLLVSTKALLQCIEHPTLATLILPRFLSDLLAALCQLGYAPSKYILIENGNAHASVDEKCESSNPPELTEPINVTSEWLTEQKLQSRRQLDSILNQIYQPLVVRELLVLQGSSSPESTKAVAVKAPLWLRKTISNLLTGRLLKPHGVQAVIRGVLDVAGKASFGESGEGNASDWRKCDVVAKLIATCPTQIKSPEEYFQVICPQIIELLQLKDKVTRRQFLRIARASIGLIAEQHPALVDKFIFIPVMKPLLLCCKTDDYDNELPLSALLKQTKIATAEELRQCIENLQLIFDVGCNPNAATLDHLKPVIDILFHLYSSTKVSVLHVSAREILQNLLTLYLRLCVDTESVAVLKLFLFPDHCLENVFQWNNQFSVHVNGDGWFQVNVEQKDDEFHWLDEDELKVIALVELLVALNKDECVSAFFLALLEELTVALGSNEGDKLKKTSTTSRHLLLDIEEAAEKRIGDIRRSLLVVHVLRALTERPSVQECLLKDKLSALHFIQVTLERGAEICLQNSTITMETETLSMAMSFVVLMLSEELKTDMKVRLKDLLPALDVLKAKHADENVQELASQLHMAILTHNVIKSAGTKSTSSSDDSLPSSSSRVKRNTSGRKGVAFSKRRTAGGTSPNLQSSPEEKTDFQQAWFDANDPLIPVQGHALLTLSKLILAKDKEAMMQKDKLLHIFQKSLDHEDSYVYLMAVQGLASLASVFPDDVIPLLAAEFANFGTDHRKVQESPELRMKLGEVLVKSTQDLGDMLPKYRDCLLNAFLCGLRDEDNHVRASCLSNLGEVCRGLRYSVGRHIHEIFNCLSSFVKTDPAVEVRRAAALVLTLLLRGLGKVAFDVLGALMKDVYRLLKAVYTVESDEVVKLHIQLALEELNILAKDFLFPPQTLTKQIHVLDPPSL